MAVLFFGLLVGEVLTVFTNGDRLVYGPLVLQGLAPYDAASRVMLTVTHLLPLLLARKFLAAPEHHKTLVVAFVIAGLIYSLPTLWEVRMSPKLNEQIYGLNLKSWIQHVRNDGYRPLVFLHHGLWLAIFMAVCCVAAVGYIRVAQPSHRIRAMLAAVWLLGTLVLMNSLGGLLIALALVIPVFFLTQRLQMLIATGLIVVVLAYPMLRGAGLVPIERALAFAEQISPERAKSLSFRIRHEDVLLNKAQQRPLFGWGSWGRNQVYNEDGGDTTVTDGQWIILIGSNGWLGYLTRFGLLCVPIVLLAFRRYREPNDRATTAIAMMLTANMLDLIPNATITPITWFLTGALIGRLEYKPSPAGGGITTTENSPDATEDRQTVQGTKSSEVAPTYSRQKAVHHRQKKGPTDGQ